MFGLGEVVKGREWGEGCEQRREMGRGWAWLARRWRIFGSMVRQRMTAYVNLLGSCG